MSGRGGGGGGPLIVPLYYDFASSLCYVTHRVMSELGGDVAGLGLELDWKPLDLAALRGLKVGAALRPSDRERVRVVSDDLGVPLRMPACWLDSRAALAAAAAVGGARGPTWRELVWSAIYETGAAPETREAIRALGAPLGFELDDASLDAGAARVAANTEQARRDEVTGVPTFQLGRWPFGGIQQRDTMLRVLGRYARKAREGALRA